MEEEILKSEEHLSEASLKGAKQAKLYLEELLNYPNSGLLEHEIIITVNHKLCNINKGAYSLNQRMTTYKGLELRYCNPDEIYHRMQISIDQFNETCCYRNAVYQALVDFVLGFFEIHPFSDGNGRTIKYLVWYVLKGFKKLNRFYCLDYDNWCDIIHQKCNDKMLRWLKSMK